MNQIANQTMNLSMNNPKEKLLINTNSIQKLIGQNFLPWKRQVVIVLKLKGLEDALTKEDPDEIIDMQAILILLETMDNSHKLQVQSETSARKIMQSLDRQYANMSAANKHRMLSNFFRYKKALTQTLNQHIGKMKEMRASLLAMGEEISEDMLQVTILDSVTKEFPDMLSTWKTMHKDLKTTECLIILLQQKEEQSKAGGSSQLMIPQQLTR